jgi:hypothetical protein
MGYKVYKAYINYNCPNCLKSFGNRKDNLESHLNKKKQCENITQITQNTAQITQNIPLCVEIKQSNVNKKEELLNEKEKIINFPCEFCDKIFTRKFCLDRHLKTCKKLPIIQQNIAIKTENRLSEIDLKLDLILKQNEELKNENIKLKKQISKKVYKATKTQNNVNINQPININVVNNNNNNIINFNDMNYDNIDKKLFVGPILDRRLFGKAIILKMIENIYINENLPEYQNLVITDKNRGYIKIFNNGKWKTDNLNTINLVLDGIVEHSKVILDELYEIYLGNNQTTSRLNTSNKYISLCDLAHLEELKDEQETDQVDNIKEIKRCEEFRDMVFKDTINLFHDNKNILIKPKRLID